MKITDTGNIKLNRLAKKAAKPGVSGNFSTYLEGSSGADAAAEPAAASSMNMIDSLIAVQQMEVEYSGNQESVRYGQELLDFLDEIKIGMLGGGNVSLEKLKHLKEGLNKDRNWVIDNKIAGVLDEIETRTKVEIAKMEVARGS